MPRRPTPCLAEVRAESAKEGIRFDKDAQGHVTWISYGQENGADVTFHQVAIALTSDSPKLVTARTLAPATGLLATKRPIPEGTTMRVELVDDRTIAMLDPKKGRPVFRRDLSGKAGQALPPGSFPLRSAALHSEQRDRLRLRLPVIR